MARSVESGAPPPRQSDSVSETWLAAILEATPDAIIAVTSDGTIVTANAQAERLFGYRRDELIGQPVDLLLPERLRARHAGHRNAFIADPRTRPMGAGLDLATRHKDGREIPVEISLSPLPMPDGLYVISAIRDISERRLAEQDRARLAAIVEWSGDIIIGMTLDGVVTSWNAAARQLYGYSAEEMVGRSITRLVPPERAGEIACVLGAIQRGDRVNPFETVRVAKNGRRIDVELMVSPVRGARGVVIGAATIGHDITARKRAEAALRESEERFRGAFAAAAIGMALVSPEGRFLQVNRSLSQILGYSEDELLGMTFQAVTHPDDLEGDLAQVKRALAGEIASYGIEKRYLHKCGGVVWVLLSVSLVRGDDGAPLYFVSQLQDVTAAREAERLKDEFIATVSHELRTPLTSIGGYVDLLLDGAGGELPETAQRFLKIVRQNSSRLIALANDLLDMSRLEAGKMDLRREAVDLAAQLHEVAASFMPQIAAKRQTLRLDLPASLPPIWADAQRSAQIFINLISNAHKYTPAGGSIIVTASDEGDGVRVDVVDSGIGISLEEQEHLFTRFFRAAHRATRTEQGAGLGLPITRALVELHGGTIAVQSAPGNGSTFSVWLPTEARALAPAVMMDASAVDGAPRSATRAMSPTPGE